MSCDILKPCNRLCGLITAENWGTLLPDSVIKRTHPSNHKKASLNINISAEHLSKNMTATGLPPLKSVWNWDLTGNSYWFVPWKLFTILPAFSLKDPKWTTTIFTIATWLKIETFQVKGAPVKKQRRRMGEYYHLCPVTGFLLDCSLSLQIRSFHCKHARAVIHMASHTF